MKGSLGFQFGEDAHRGGDEDPRHTSRSKKSWNLFFSSVISCPSACIVFEGGWVEKSNFIDLLSLSPKQKVYNISWGPRDNQFSAMSFLNGWKQKIFSKSKYINTLPPPRGDDMAVQQNFNVDGVNSTPQACAHTKYTSLSGGVSVLWRVTISLTARPRVRAR